MEYNKILDNFLKQIIFVNQNKGGLPFQSRDLRGHEHLSVLDKELILQMFVRDRYVTESKNDNHGYWITFEGKMFLAQGGYSRQFKEARNTNNLGKFQFWLLLAAAFFATLYYGKEMCVWLWYHFSFCG